MSRVAQAPTETPNQTWRWLCKEILNQKIPFAVHQLLHRAIYDPWDEAQRGPAPVWVPSAEERARTNISALIPGDDFSAVHHYSVRQPELYWAKVFSALRIRFDKPPERILSAPVDPTNTQWLPGATMNIAQSCFAQRRSGDVALAWQNTDGAICRLKRSELLARVRQIAVSLYAAGFEPEDRIAIHLPMSVDKICLYLGIVWAGCVVVGIDAHLPEAAVQERLKLSRAKAVFTSQTHTSETSPAICLSKAHGSEISRKDKDLSWQEFVDLLPAKIGVLGYEPLIVSAELPTHVLFSSDSEGKLKTVSWNHLTPIKAAADGWAHHDIKIGDVVAWPQRAMSAETPWLLYASLLNGGSLALFDGDPHAREWGTFIQDLRVTFLDVLPSEIRSWRQSKCMSGLDWSSIKCFSVKNGQSVKDDMHWLMAFAGYKPVIESRDGLITGSLMQPQAPTACSTKVLGVNFKILDEMGREAFGGACVKHASARS